MKDVMDAPVVNTVQNVPKIREEEEQFKAFVKQWFGFLPNNRTADHVLTLPTLMDKYVHCHQEKVYACFVDFRKAFDSVWLDGLLYKLLEIHVGGNFNDLIKSLYYNSTGSVRIEDSQTQSFQYAREFFKAAFNLDINGLP